ncbi:phosphoadenosine phosphosulfate reductase family protein [Roseomonas terrae]|jgi:3'-phosphoadenosine 5'-phosphosulfate sulfotransferase (PAPS reductase)/FAD synthetase|uniref:Phosphoadenosine phosphosulfate reductase family protein n=1 Tax=Neoroseomonas terrae TaxID=424799 RepID=A0ABS5ELS7_9PROT|nr:phosphoadenosine phosphosulfate reductase family protein [Neoroseomonas terrae]MBR0651988.1 phosphoadenosine phosphosulfate reductase family protein [Neoroseomonas terrae]
MTPADTFVRTALPPIGTDLRAAIEAAARPAAAFSGGKDSLAVVYLLREAGLLDRVTLYHLDTGDLLPEVREIVDHVKAFAPRFVHLQGDVLGWIERNGAPSDLVPGNGREPPGTGPGSIVQRYACCYANLMLPLWERIAADGVDLLFRGTRRDDLPRLPADDGAILPGGMLLRLPLREWKAEDVFRYLRSVGAPIARLYHHKTQSPECARCTAWWHESRAAYLRQFYPDLFADYRKRLAPIASALLPVVDAVTAAHAAILERTDA